MDEKPSHTVTSWKVPEELSDGDAVIYGQKYKQIRLPVLKYNPKAFSSDYAYESSLSKEEWAETIKAPNFHYFIALSTPVGQSPDPKQDEWVGSVCIYGPMGLDSYNSIGDPIQPSPYVNETYWDISACQTSPTAQMGYVFGLVMHAMYDWVNNYTRARFHHELSQKRAFFRFSGRTMPGMDKLLAMYRRKGFWTRGLTSRREVLRMRNQDHLANNPKLSANVDVKKTIVVEGRMETRPGKGPHAWFEASERRKQMMGDDKAVSSRTSFEALAYLVLDSTSSIEFANSSLPP